ncbi:chaperonin 10-like protein [Cercophora scortea]|uniref:Chaperonin 10-like protein n=1 Tax=Cercophora scortea TaxID=314031 RepID=A0AAE0IAC4_9PEZI|nr:chaperonin 10-like protein [Cercophora scortea]
MATNTGAFLTAANHPLVVQSAPYPTPGPNEVVIKAQAVALNPCDWAMLMLGPDFFKGLKLPCVIGEDVAGEVTAVGPGVTTFKPGSRVAGLATAAFQTHVLLKSHLTIPIPASLPYTQAAVMPLALSTAVKALFHKDYLHLTLPSTTPPPPRTNQTVLIWGASTSVGSNAIQLAVAAGYEVITTASPSNFPLALQLGAARVFDYNSPTVTADLIDAFRGKTTPGALCNSGPAPTSHPAVIAACAAVIAAPTTIIADGSARFLALTMATPAAEYLPEGVEGKFVEPLEGDEELAAAVFGGYMPAALVEGRFVPAPMAQVVGHGLGALQSGIDMLKAGVSARKLIVTL